MLPFDLTGFPPEALVRLVLLNARRCRLNGGHETPVAYKVVVHPSVWLETGVAMVRLEDGERVRVEIGWGMTSSKLVEIVPDPLPLMPVEQMNTEEA